MPYNNAMQITMVGTGYVGLVTGTCLANVGNHVTCLDIDGGKIARLNEGHCPIHEPGLDALIRRNVKAGRLMFTTDAVKAYRTAETIFICVGTPPLGDGQADLSYVLGVAGEIGRAIQSEPDDGRPPKIIVVKSTVPVGTHTAVRRVIGEQTDRPFRIASNPEFLKEGQAINDFNKPDRVVLGVEDRQTGERLRDLYEPFVRQGNPIFVMDIPSAEMVKYASNTMLATKISFVNEMAALCEAYGADIDEVRRGMCSDKRIGNQFLYPGLGYGGSCFPKDVKACIGMGRQRHTPIDLLSAVDQVNQRQRRRFIEKLDRHFADDGLAGRRVAIWGLAFKPGTDDMREAPAITVIEHLLDRGAQVVAFDPVAVESAKRIFGNRIAYADNEMDVLNDADALVICTEWSEFRHPEFEEIKSRMRSPVVFDGRNLYRLDVMREHGFTYYSVGRPIIRHELQTAAPHQAQVKVDKT
jgi:UDPglucose 6-dehydrogenase